MPNNARRARSMVVQYVFLCEIKELSDIVNAG